MNPPKVRSILCGAAALSFAFATSPALRAADHGDAPTLGPDQGADIADVYAFLDPNDNDSVVLIGTSRGFITPQEAGNFALFDPNVRYTFGIENTGDAIPDLFIDVKFSPRIQKADKTFAQDAFVSLRGAVPKTFSRKKGKFDAVPVYQPNTLSDAANSQTMPINYISALKNTANASTGISFFAGEADDPFFFDIPGFNRFVASVLAGTPDFTTLDRARDSFAGYNVLGISIKVPKTLLYNAKAKDPTTAPTRIGANFVTARGSEHTVKGVNVGSGAFQQVDRIGVPGINVAFLSYNRKNAYNGGTTLDDAKGAFFGDIATTLTALGTNDNGPSDSPAGVKGLSTLAAVAGLPSLANAPAAGAVLKDKTKFGLGDFLRLETDKTKPVGATAMPLAANMGPTGGTNAGVGFPNGRRPADDVIDTVLYLVTNGGLTTGDKVGASDIPPQDAFPFLALPQQPRANGVIDDNTRN